MRFKDFNIFPLTLSMPDFLFFFLETLNQNKENYSICSFPIIFISSCLIYQICCSTWYEDFMIFFILWLYDLVNWSISK